MIDQQQEVETQRPLRIYDTVYLLLMDKNKTKPDHLTPTIVLSPDGAVYVMSREYLSQGQNVLEVYDKRGNVPQFQHKEEVNGYILGLILEKMKAFNFQVTEIKPVGEEPFESATWDPQFRTLKTKYGWFNFAEKSPGYARINGIDSLEADELRGYFQTDSLVTITKTIFENAGIPFEEMTVNDDRGEPYMFINIHEDNAQMAETAINFTIGLITSTKFNLKQKSLKRLLGILDEVSKDFDNPPIKKGCHHD